MEIGTIISPILYSSVYYTTITIICMLTSFYYILSNGQTILQRNQNEKPPFFALVFAILITVFIGLRPVSGIFIDMTMYAHVYENIITDYSPFSLSTEWLWDNITFFCKEIGLSTTHYFLVIATIYIGTAFSCCLILLRNNVWIAFLFIASSFSFIGYGTNGLCNGTACHIFLLGIALFTSKGKKKYIGFLLCLSTLAIHRACMLPFTMLLLSLYVVKQPKQAINIWIASIGVSLVLGNYFTNIVTDFGIDERMNEYLKGQGSPNILADNPKAGTFRFDFLLYSAMPVLMFWYVTVKRNFKDRTYNLIAITYILANSFWVIVIRASQSNRFAYLSWFIYPIVIAYPLLRFNIWKNQDQKAAIILLLYAGFTFTMFLLG